MVEPQNGVPRYLTELKMCDNSALKQTNELDKHVRERLHDKFRRTLNNMKEK